MSIGPTPQQHRESSLLKAYRAGREQAVSGAACDPPRWMDDPDALLVRRNHSDFYSGKRRCPECHEICGWCSWYRMNARHSGCGVSGRKKCEKGEAERGKKCSTCDGSGYVEVRVEIVKPKAGGAA